MSLAPGRAVRLRASFVLPSRFSSYFFQRKYALFRKYGKIHACLSRRPDPRNGVSIRQKLRRSPSQAGISSEQFFQTQSLLPDRQIPTPAVAFRLESFLQQMQHNLHQPRFNSMLLFTAHVQDLLRDVLPVYALGTLMT